MHTLRTCSPVLCPWAWADPNSLFCTQHQMRFKAQRHVQTNGRAPLPRAPAPAFWLPSQSPFVKPDQHFLKLELRTQLAALVLNLLAEELVVHDGQRCWTLLSTRAHSNVRDNLQTSTKRCKCTSHSNHAYATGLFIPHRILEVYHFHHYCCKGVGVPGHLPGS